MVVAEGQKVRTVVAATQFTTQRVQCDVDEHTAVLERKKASHMRSEKFSNKKKPQESPGAFWKNHLWVLSHQSS